MTNATRSMTVDHILNVVFSIVQLIRVLVDLLATTIAMRMVDAVTIIIFFKVLGFEAGRWEMREVLRVASVIEIVVIQVVMTQNEILAVVLMSMVSKVVNVLMIVTFRTIQDNGLHIAFIGIQRTNGCQSWS